MCAEAIFQAIREVQGQGQAFETWLYRGAWEEWEPHEIERVVPLSPDEVERKKAAIFRHQSQKDRAMFPGGSDRREFWQRAEDRNRHTAKVYDALGLPEFYALEGFVQWRGNI
jgi:glucosamine-6-phosphate deaminase